ncbi:MAG: DUF4230 domain-containing protein [Actinomycetota bacterium]
MFKQVRRRARSVYAAGAVTAGLLVAAAIVSLQLLGNPFATTTVDRSLPPLLVELCDLADDHAAQGQFEVTVDREDDVALLPSVIAGERVQYAALGSVDAVVDFGALTDAAITLPQGEGTVTVTVTLPEPVLATPVLDLEHSHVMNRDRGLLNRIGGLFSDNPTSEHALQAAAVEEVAAAAEASGLRSRAEQNTRAMLTAMLGALGFDDSEMRFER